MCTSRYYGNKSYSIDILMFKTHLFTCKLLLISIHMTACTRTINITCHSTVNGVSENSVQDRAQAVAMATKHPKLSIVCRSKIPIWMQTPPDFDPCNGLCMHNRHVFPYSIYRDMTCDADCACTSRHIDRNQEEFASKIGILLRQTIYNLECFVAIATACARS